MSRFCALRAIALLGALPLVAACAGPRGEPFAATPQRPTFSSDTSTTARGTLELEAGVSVDPGEAMDTPVALKVGLTERADAFAAFSPYVSFPQSGPNARGPSDLFLGTKIRFSDEDDTLPSFAVQLATKLPTASTRSGVATGEMDAFTTLIATKALGPFTVTANYQLGFLGEPADDDFDLQHGGAIAGGIEVAPKLSAFAEIAGVFVHEQDVEAVLQTTGIAYAPRPDLVFDTGVQIGLSSDARDFFAFVGVTFNLGAWLGAIGGDDRD